MSNNNAESGASPEELGKLVEWVVRRDIPAGSHFNLEDVVDLLGNKYPVEAVTNALRQIEQRGEIAGFSESEPPEFRRLR